MRALPLASAARLREDPTSGRAGWTKSVCRVAPPSGRHACRRRQRGCAFTSCRAPPVDVRREQRRPVSDSAPCVRRTHHRRPRKVRAGRLAGGGRPQMGVARTGDGRAGQGVPVVGAHRHVGGVPFRSSSVPATVHQLRMRQEGRTRPPFLCSWYQTDYKKLLTTLLTTFIHLLIKYYIVSWCHLFICVSLFPAESCTFVASLSG